MIAMTWTRISDEFYDDADQLTLSDSAFRAHILALVWCNKHLRDGALPRRNAAMLGATDGDVGELVEVGWWQPTNDGWQLDWSDQEPANDVIKRQEHNRERQRRYARRKAAHDQGDHSLCDPRYCKRAKTTPNALGNASSNDCSNGAPVPTRPDPSRPKVRDGVRGEATGSPWGSPALATSEQSEADSQPGHPFEPHPDGIDECHQCGLPNGNSRHKAGDGV